MYACDGVVRLSLSESAVESVAISSDAPALKWLAIPFPRTLKPISSRWNGSMKTGIERGEKPGKLKITKIVYRSV